MWISSSWHAEEVDWYQPELSATNGCMFLAGATLRALCSLIEHLICVSPAHKLCRWCAPKSTRANFKFVFHYWKVTFYSRSHCVGRFSDRGEDSDHDISTVYAWSDSASGTQIVQNLILAFHAMGITVWVWSDLTARETHECQKCESVTIAHCSD